jgi:hypothetical protein
MLAVVRPFSPGRVARNLLLGVSLVTRTTPPVIN